jgi:hypothetical protein
MEESKQMLLIKITYTAYTFQSLSLCLTLTAETVNPAEVDPTPVVSTDRGQTLDTNRRRWDFPVPGSPTSNR